VSFPCLGPPDCKHLDLLIAKKPGDLPVSDKVRITENTVDIKLGEGLWKTASNLTPYRQDIIDARQGVAGTPAVIEEGKNADSPFAPDSYRIENGYVTAGKGCMMRPTWENLKTQPIPTPFEITSRIAAVDEEMGIVWVRMDFGKNSMGVGPEADKQSLIVWEAFKVYDGQIPAVEAFMLARPRGRPPGWDAR
jgi:hypothetical protein